MFLTVDAFGLIRTWLILSENIWVRYEKTQLLASCQHVGNLGLSQSTVCENMGNDGPTAEMSVRLRKIYQPFWLNFPIKNWNFNVLFFFVYSWVDRYFLKAEGEFCFINWMFCSYQFFFLFFCGSMFGGVPYVAEEGGGVYFFLWISSPVLVHFSANFSPVKLTNCEAEFWRYFAWCLRKLVCFWCLCTCFFRRRSCSWTRPF